MPTTRLWIAIAASVLAYSPVQAQSDTAKTTGPTVAVNIEAQPIRGALQAFGKETGIQVLFRSEDASIGEVITPRVAGKLSAREALERLLAKTGLTYEFINEHTVRISSAHPSSMREAADPGGPAASAGDSRGPGDPIDSQRKADGTFPSKRQDENAAAENSFKLEEIVVTATKRAEPLKEVPSSITAMTGGTLDTLGVKAFADYMPYVPSLQVNSSPLGGGGVGQGTIILRGLNSGSGQSTLTTAFYMDETLLTPSSASAISVLNLPDPDLSDVERIEVLKGPQSTLYGASALGGLIRVISKKPDLVEFSGRARVDGAAIDGGGTGGGFSGSVNIPVVAGQFAVKLSAFDRLEPGYVDNLRTGQTNVNSARVDGAQLTLRYAPTERLDIELGGFIEDIDNHGLAYQDLDATTLQPLAGRYQYSADFNNMTNTRNTLGNLTATYRLDSGTITSATSYAHYSSHQSYDRTDVFAPLFPFIPNFALLEPAAPTMDKFSEDLRFSSNRIGPWELQGGLFYTHEKIGYSACYCGVDGSTGARLDTVATTIDLHAVYKEYAIYGDATFHFTDRLDATVGVRESHNTQEADTVLSGFIVGGATLDEPSQSSGSDTSYLFTARWRATDAISTYLRVASAYRPGGPQFGATPGAPLSFGPDTVWNYEVGAKGLWLDGRLSADTALYYLDWKGIQLSSAYNGLTVIQNGGNAHSEGVEFQSQFKVTSQFLLGANAAYDQTRMDSISPTSTVGAVVGDPLPYTPKWSGAFTADYSYPLANSTGTFGASYRYQGSAHSSFSADRLNTDVRIPAYSVVDLRSSLDWSRYKLTLRVDNVANEYALANTLFTRLFPGQPVPGNGIPIEPRTYRLSLEARF